MNEKRNFFAVCFITAVILVSGCGTIGRAADNAVIGHQARIIELENANRDLAERLGQYDKLAERTVKRLEAVRERAGGIGDAADRIEYLFAEYERTVQQLIRELRANGRQVGKGTDACKDVVNYLAMLGWVEGLENYCRLYLAGN
jgi:hypothetical protein